MFTNLDSIKQYAFKGHAEIIEAGTDFKKLYEIFYSTHLHG